MKLTELHLVKYARMGGSLLSMFTAEQGFTIEVRTDLGGVVVSHKNRSNPEKMDHVWVPFANCLNGVPAEVPNRASK